MKRPGFLKRGERVRLQTFLARSGVSSRRAAEEMITHGRIAVNGETVTAMGLQVVPGVDRVEVDGVEVKVAPVTWLALHKPTGYVTTRTDPFGRRTVYELLPEKYHSLFHVGRLDRDSEGLLLLTNDGELANRFLHPSHGVTKEYDVIVTGKPSDAVLRELVEGVELEDGVARAESARLIGPAGNGQSRVKMVLGEGKKREVRRMLAAVGHEVMRLVRRRFGPIELAELPKGKWRIVAPEELTHVREPRRDDRPARPPRAGEDAEAPRPRAKVSARDSHNVYGDQPVKRHKPAAGAGAGAAESAEDRPRGKAAAKSAAKPAGKTGKTTAGKPAGAEDRPLRRSASAKPGDADARPKTRAAAGEDRPRGKASAAGADRPARKPAERDAAPRKRPADAEAPPRKRTAPPRELSDWAEAPRVRGEETPGRRPGQPGQRVPGPRGRIAPEGGRPARDQGVFEDRPPPRAKTGARDGGGYERPDRPERSSSAPRGKAGARDGGGYERPDRPERSSSAPRGKAGDRDGGGYERPDRPERSSSAPRGKTGARDGAGYERPDRPERSSSAPRGKTGARDGGGYERADRPERTSGPGGKPGPRRTSGGFGGEGRSEAPRGRFGGEDRPARPRDRDEELGGRFERDDRRPPSRGGAAERGDRAARPRGRTADRDSGPPASRGRGDGPPSRGRFDREERGGARDIKPSAPREAPASDEDFDELDSWGTTPHRSTRSRGASDRGGADRGARGGKPSGGGRPPGSRPSAGGKPGGKPSGGRPSSGGKSSGGRPGGRPSGGGKPGGSRGGPGGAKPRRPGGGGGGRGR